jgi:hypothetical protein
MKGSINQNWYCSLLVSGGKCNQPNPTPCNSSCTYCHRKYPTPDQFREEYGEDWKGGIYALVNISGVIGWYELPRLEINAPIVCACTPFGLPHRDWRLS